MKDNQQTSEQLNDRNVTYTEGYTFTFVHQGHEIVAFGSAKSGKETLTIDGKLISKKRSFGRRSVHTFMLNGTAFEVEFYMANMFTGELHCSLIEDGTHVATQKKALKKRYHISSRFRILVFLGLFVAGGVLGYLTMLLALTMFDA